MDRPNRHGLQWIVVLGLLIATCLPLGWLLVFQASAYNLANGGGFLATIATARSVHYAGGNALLTMILVVLYPPFR